jgi:speckle-type POZ protein
MKEAATNSVIQIQDMEAKVFKALLGFVYTDSMPKMEVDGGIEEGRAEVMWLQHLFVASDRYDLQRLKSMCEQKLSERINLNLVSTILALAVQHHC